MPRRFAGTFLIPTLGATKDTPVAAGKGAAICRALVEPRDEFPAVAGGLLHNGSGMRLLCEDETDETAPALAQLLPEPRRRGRAVRARRAAGAVRSGKWRNGLETVLLRRSLARASPMGRQRRITRWNAGRGNLRPRAMKQTILR